MRTTLLSLACLILTFILSARADPTIPNQGATTMPNTQQAAFAGGCFWGTETMFRKVPGVLTTQVGYAGGTTDHPTYKSVCTGLTGHAETVLVTYDPTKVSYPELLDAFWSMHDPTTLGRQGPDHGSQYRSVIFTSDDQQAQLAAASKKEVDDSAIFKDRGKIVTQIVKLEKFYPAEDYHQQYFEKAGEAASCHVGIAHVHTKLAAAAAQQRQQKSP